jgi:site-specific DNA-cytosine methylase
MTLDSSNEVVAILYDIENAPFEMLNYTLGKARRYQPCRTIVVSDWEARPEQKRWEQLMRRPDFTFRQISRTYQGKNSLDSAIYDSAKLLYDEGVRRFFIITTDSDFVRIADSLNKGTPSYIIGVGTKQASESLRNAYNEFFVYPPEEEMKKSPENDKPAAEEKAVSAKKAKAKTVKPAKEKETKEKAAKESNKKKTAMPQAEEKQPQAKGKSKAAAQEKSAPEKAAEQKGKAKGEPLQAGTLSVRIPKSLRRALEERRLEEEVTMDELVTYILMRGLR